MLSSLFELASKEQQDFLESLLYGHCQKVIISFELNIPDLPAKFPQLIPHVPSLLDGRGFIRRPM